MHVELWRAQSIECVPCASRARVSNLCAGAAVQLLKDALQLSRANKNRRQQYDIIGYLFDVCIGRQHYKAAKQHAERQLQLALALKVGGVDTRSCL